RSVVGVELVGCFYSVIWRNIDHRHYFWFVGRDPPILATSILRSVSHDLTNHENQTVHIPDDGVACNPQRPTLNLLRPRWPHAESEAVKPTSVSLTRYANAFMTPAS